LTLLLTDFRALAPRYLATQAETLAWLSAAHARAEFVRARQAGTPFDEAKFHEQMTRRIARFGCGPENIASRGHELHDCTHRHWSEMQVYRLDENATGEGALTRTQVYGELAKDALHRIYADSDAPPDDILHVTCTGYASPSAAQRVVSDKGWGNHTRVFHAYHMGCYAAFPALRAAGAFVEARAGKTTRSPRSDVVHTEICSLHFNPLLHTPEQLVVQTLFSDGFIAYGVEDGAYWHGNSPALELLSLDERILPNSSDAMTWVCSDWGMKMTLARDVPEQIEGELRTFVGGLLDRAGLRDEQRHASLFAIHPGGPRILDRAQTVLELQPAQLQFSRKVLRDRGNMSSATLPHVWLEILRAGEVEDGRTIVSLAFGPGLTICGAVLRKRVP
jgi:predicted naringenin-chalcone synthase